MELFQSNFACLHVCLAFALFRFGGFHFQVFGKACESEILELYLTILAQQKMVLLLISSDLRINPPATPEAGDRIIFYPVIRIHPVSILL